MEGMRNLRKSGGDQAQSEYIWVTSQCLGVIWGTGPGNGGTMGAALENRAKEGAEREKKGENEVQSQ